MTELSPAAQKLMAAVTQRLYCLDPQDVPAAADELAYLIAATLRAAADQVLPDCQEPGLGTCDIDLYTEHQRKRSALLAIAAELDPTTETK